jgi:hypothetical protein
MRNLLRLIAALFLPHRRVVAHSVCLRRCVVIGGGIIEVAGHPSRIPKRKRSGAHDVALYRIRDRQMTHCETKVRLTMRRNLLSSLLGGMCFSILPQSRIYGADSPMQANNLAIHFSAGGTTTSWLGFDMPDRRRIILTGTINNKAAKILLDSGVGRVGP